jgi:hypothetical protein
MCGGALQYVGIGLSPVAFVVAAPLKLTRLLEPFLRTGGPRISRSPERVCGRRSRLDRLWREARGVAGWRPDGSRMSTETMSLAVTKSCMRALATTSLLAILALSLVPGAFRPHTMILPFAFEHVAAYAVAAFFLAWPAIIACRRCSLFCCSPPLAHCSSSVSRGCLGVMGSSL